MKLEVIPAIDLIEGKCVRLSQGDYGTKKVYDASPLDLAKQFEDAGIKRLHLVDLEGAKIKKVTNHKVLEEITANTNLIVDFGGGIQAEEDLQKAFDHGAHFLTCGSIAVKDRPTFESWLNKFGSDKFILAADAKDRKIAIHGWMETSDLEVTEFIRSYKKLGVNSVLCTDISKDGMLQGTSVDLYKEIQSEFPDLELIASGGVSGIEDLIALDEAGIYGVVVGKAFYEGRLTIDQLAKKINS
ncbi:1-(5-phosphoribosyl)-5-[(5-phosphoribosylamino)methylideneamino]imidazole-4-carboxamide isomerase [Sediminitomix flava]|uniref:1-(5-phosphoribosyl)-5-[(5-phosphoribosylamino)methylideneamino] imidazole-4-carboxamide isomerase n=1 Tax=Sediminitomix flava TaxID=379075 RepID=A0A315ZEL1_SEDFL|nr:1-(5-phosphoribosyl)-5-[(5-phosphoribosylamino)methylideneamino]imidazole-4-carboxamide isomerase [Sediminitomix flava]PWJ44005.1 1-(5-phosphoribosyl)-5-[(5-phosphoribosylamino)methylideneamino] imidazole-4-carboxamide isomerase [Sediminitomix flava]